jgi:hypothetical protein
MLVSSKKAPARAERGRAQIQGSLTLISEPIPCIRRRLFMTTKYEGYAVYYFTNEQIAGVLSEVVDAKIIKFVATRSEAKRLVKLYEIAPEQAGLSEWDSVGLMESSAWFHDPEYITEADVAAYAEFERSMPL